MSAYVDGFVVPVPADKLDDYKRLSKKAGHPKAMPFDVKRMFFGGFKTLVEM